MIKRKLYFSKEYLRGTFLLIPSFPIYWYRCIDNDPEFPVNWLEISINIEWLRFKLSFSYEVDYYADRKASRFEF